MTLVSVSRPAALLAGAALLLAACGETRSERALSGAAIGAGVGAAGAAVSGGAVATGAVVGGAVGAGAGALTDEDVRRRRR